MNPSTQPPKFSILIATYNAAEPLQRCLDSIARQKAGLYEVLIADGGSTDGTHAIVEASDHLVAHRIFGPDGGPYDAWNKLLPHARGEWIMFLGADDQLATPDTLRLLAERCARLPVTAPQLAFVFGVTEFVAGDEIIERFGEQAMPGDQHDLATDFSLSHTGLLHHRDLFSAFGPFSAEYAIAGDAHFMLRSALDPRTRFFHAPFPVARMAAGGLSSSVASRVACYAEVEKARRELGVKPIRPHWLAALQFRSALAARIQTVLGKKALLLAANLYRTLSGKRARSDYR
ncbi:glycosyltransferase [Qipengyuania sp. DSG2-2]|uniref:glycosyltransferase n=1 Tax=Qipengyuania sp. DGS2-2 TaxID=3349631 RepID=UPI0036D3FBEB